MSKAAAIRARKVDIEYYPPKDKVTILRPLEERQRPVLVQQVDSDTYEWIDRESGAVVAYEFFYFSEMFRGRGLVLPVAEPEVQFEVAQEPGRFFRLSELLKWARKYFKAKPVA